MHILNKMSRFAERPHRGRPRPTAEERQRKFEALPLTERLALIYPPLKPHEGDVTPSQIRRVLERDR